MTSTEQNLEVRGNDRRAFFRTAGSAAVAIAGASAIASCGGGGGSGGTATPTPTPSATSTSTVAYTDVDLLTFALNIEYLEAQYYGFAANGAGLATAQVTGLGSQGVVSGGRQVAFADPLVAQYAREIAADKAAHVAFLRTTLGSANVAQPPIDLSVGATGAFSTLAQIAGLVPAGGTFDPFSSDENFLLGAFFFADLGVTAYKGVTPLVTNKTFLDGLAGILAAKSYHAGLVRTALYRKGVGNNLFINASEALSTARDFLDGAGDDDQGIAPLLLGPPALTTISNIVPTDSNGLAYSRSVSVALNVYFLTQASVASGGFFPSGLNSSFTVSGATA